MLARRLTLTGILLCVAAQAATAARIEATATASWGGWTRPERVTEVELRLGAPEATNVAIALHAGRQTILSAVRLEPGRPVALHLPAPTPRPLSIELTPDGGPPQRLDVATVAADAPLLASALAEGRAALDGFHSVAVGPRDLPWRAAAYTSVDALIIDEATLAALGEHQLAALIDHAAACGRIALVGVGATPRRLIEEAAGCRGRHLVRAESTGEAVAALAASLEASSDSVRPVANPQRRLPAVPAAWTIVVAGTALYLAVAALAALLLPWGPAIVLVSALATVGAFALTVMLPPADSLVAWTEAEPGVHSVGYRALQRFDGAGRTTRRVALAGLAGAQPCRGDEAVSLEFDPVQNRLTHAAFEAPLFAGITICYHGVLPPEQALALAGEPGEHPGIPDAGPSSDTARRAPTGASP